MIRRLIVVVAVLFPVVAATVRPAAAPADPPPTFSHDVAPILYRKCVSCHRPGESAPMSLLSYTDARPYARAIKDKVTARQMPPWFADPAVGEFANDPRLTEKEIATIASWADAGALQGDASQMPAAPHFTEGWQLGEPDYTVDLPEVQIPATGPDIFPTPSIALGLAEDRWIRAIEIRPSNRDVAHHAVIFATAGNPMTGDGLFDVLGVWAVGTPATVYPEGEGRWIRKGQTLRTNLHYHPNGTAQTDHIRVGFYFGRGELKKEVAAGLLGNIAITIPPNAPNHEIRSTFVVDQDVTLVSLFPHMHLRGKDMTITAFLPGGHERTLLRVPAYDFNWQLFYYPKTAVKLPRGTRLELVSHYDNSAGNKRNPNPAATVHFGESSNDEMNFGMYEFTADAGVSPVPSTDRSHMDALAMSFEPGTALRVDVPFTANHSAPFVFYLPKSGAARNYISVQGARIGIAAIQNLAWDGSSFAFQTGVLGVPGGNGQYNVRGTVDASGAVHGTMERRVPANSGSFDFTGTINK
jgi:hypothetical protein